MDRPRRSVRAVVCAVLVLGLASAARPVPVPAADPIRLAVEGATNTGVSLAASGRDVVVTWAASAPGSTDIYAAVSADEGQTFGRPTRVNDLPGDARVTGEQGPRAGIGSGIDVVWCSKAGTSARIRAARSGPAADGFAPAITVHAEGLPGARGWASLARDPEGNAHVVWLDGRAADRGAAARPMRQDLFHALWRKDGTHEEVTVATDVCFCCKTAVAAGRDGAVYVAWRHIYPTNLRDIAVARSTDGGKTFSTPVRVSEDGWQIAGCPDDGPALAVDETGTLHVAWPTMAGGDDHAAKGIFYSYSTDGGRTFAPRMRIDEAGTGAAHPQIAAGGGRVAIVWDEAGPTRRACLREVSRDPKRSGGTPVLGAIQVLSAGPAVYPAVASTPSSLVAAWTETAAAGSEIRVRRLPRD
ncbi:MAG TPA: sialidase family protein [Vicinamibacteria bacterium]|nr:sialidase family protein [Vicinamibacteria bacterium]